MAGLMEKQASHASMQTSVVKPINLHARHPFTCQYVNTQPAAILTFAAVTGIMSALQVICKRSESAPCFRVPPKLYFKVRALAQRSSTEV